MSPAFAAPSSQPRALLVGRIPALDEPTTSSCNSSAATPPARSMVEDLVAPDARRPVTAAARVEAVPALGRGGRAVSARARAAAVDLAGLALDTFLVREARGGRYWPGAERLYDAWALLRSAVAARAYPSARYFARLCCGLATLPVRSRCAPWRSSCASVRCRTTGRGRWTCRACCSVRGSACARNSGGRLVSESPAAPVLRRRSTCPGCPRTSERKTAKRGDGPFRHSSIGAGQQRSLSTRTCA